MSAEMQAGRTKSKLSEITTPVALPLSSFENWNIKTSKNPTKKVVPKTLIATGLLISVTHMQDFSCDLGISPC